MKELDKPILEQLRRLKAPDCPSLAVLDNFLEGKGSLEERQSVELHLRACPACVNRLNDLQMIDYLAEKGEEPPRAWLDEAKRLAFAQTSPMAATQNVPGRSVRDLFAAAWETLRDWMTPQVLGGLAVASLTLLFATQFVRKGPISDLPPGTARRGEPVLEPAPPAPGGATRGGGVEEPPPVPVVEAEHLRRNALALSAQGAAAKQKGNIEEARQLWTKARDLYAQAGAKPEQAEVQQWLDELDK